MKDIKPSGSFHTTHITRDQAKRHSTVVVLCLSDKWFSAEEPGFSKKVGPFCYNFWTSRFNHIRDIAENASRNPWIVITEDTSAGLCNPYLCSVPVGSALAYMDMNRLYYCISNFAVMQLVPTKFFGITPPAQWLLHHISWDRKTAVTVSRDNLHIQKNSTQDAKVFENYSGIRYNMTMKSVLEARLQGSR